MQQWPLAAIDRCADQFFGRPLPQSRRFMKIPNHLATEHPQVIAMQMQRLAAQTLDQQMQEKGLEYGNELLSGNEVAFLIVPDGWPLC
jgi:hypothetical protein